MYIYIYIIMGKLLSFDVFLNHNVKEHGYRTRLARCLSPLSSKLSPVGRVQ